LIHFAGWPETNLIVPLPKKGDLTQMSNYRGISLMSIAAKIYNKVLLYRIRDPIEQILRRNQAGFRQGRGCTEQVHILRRLIEGAIDKNLDIYAVFIDFKKAFDSLRRSTMFSILRHYGIPDKTVRVIKTIYNNSKSRVLVDGKLSDEFDVTTGVLQGDTLAPFLFIIVIDFVLKKCRKRVRRNHKITRIHNKAERVVKKSRVLHIRPGLRRRHNPTRRRQA
jgi:sorting nexin-29